MENERLKIFTEDGKELGEATREEVHKQGYWHETFHCWVISKEGDKDYIYFQIRSPQKKDHPNQIDITAAGHILAHETFLDGIREVKEEIGIDVAYEELISLGVLKYCVTKGDFIDNELAHVFLYQSPYTFNDFDVQPEEVSGMVRAEFDSFRKLYLEDQEDIHIEGFELDEAGNRRTISKSVTKKEFVPHEQVYYESIIDLISKHIK